MKKLFALILVMVFLVSVGIAGCAPDEEPVDDDANDTDQDEAVQEEFPSKPIEFVVPFGAGGGSDRWARTIASAAIEYFDGQPLRVVNRPGAGAAVGTEYVVNAEADGYTLLIASSTPVMTSMLEDTGYTYEDLICVATNRYEPTVLIAKPGGPYATWDDLVKEAQSRPGEITLGGTGGLRLNLEHLFDQVGIEVNHVPYDSTGEAVTDFLGGHIELAAVTPGTGEPLVEAGNAVAVMYTTDAPLGIAAYEGVPNAADLGLRPFGLLGFLAVHKDTPEYRVQYISDALGQIFEDDGFLGLQGLFGEDLYHIPYPESQEFYLEYCRDLEVLVRKMD